MALNRLLLTSGKPNEQATRAEKTARPPGHDPPAGLLAVNRVGEEALPSINAPTQA